MEVDACSDVLVQDVTRDNFDSLWPLFMEHIDRAAFIAIDTEMTGLGGKSGLKAPYVQRSCYLMAARITVVGHLSRIPFALPCVVRAQRWLRVWPMRASAE